MNVLFYQLNNKNRDKNIYKSQKLDIKAKYRIIKMYLIWQNLLNIGSCDKTSGITKKLEIETRSIDC